MIYIKEIKIDYWDLTMSIPIALLDGLAGDFDGDTLSFILLYDKRLIKAWDIHDPVHHFISRHTGQYSDLCEFIKDSSVIMSELYELGKSESYYNNWASEEERNKYLYKDIL